MNCCAAGPSDFRELDTKHMAMYTVPRELADLLLELA
jgi:hypothetical protein